ncbi:hypothetical protein [Sphingobium sp. DC-2]|uniref:hypothetical protein n=1 Tax=Sphingobium sp. DC-2 TaxID=1303256 RepID=UPI0004C424EF|nr:hypothetical protein [Sphingobium sp. DC-2]
MTGAISIRREAAISFLINAALSLAFFTGTFGLASRPLNWGAPGGLAFDFIPQSAAVALMSALVPPLLARRHLSGRPLRPVLLRALLLAAGGAMLGGLLAFFTRTNAPIALPAALILKLVYGGTLGALVTTVALRSLLRP